MLVFIMTDRQSGYDHKGTGLKTERISAASELYIDPELEL